MRGWYAETRYTRPDPADRYDGEAQLKYSYRHSFQEVADAVS